MASAPAYATVGGKLVVGMAEAEEQARELARRVQHSGWKPDLVLGIANGGVHPAHFAAAELGVPVTYCTVQRRTSQLKQRLKFARRALSSPLLKPVVYALNSRLDRVLGGVGSSDSSFAADVTQKGILLVDDCIDSGASVAHVRAMLLQRGVKKVEVAVLSWTTKYDSMAMHGVAPDHCLGRSLPCYPWSADSPEYPDFLRWMTDHAPPQPPLRATS
ncbi:hypoxanthine phosphoribosyltransferase [Sphingomonas sp. F9_3S_D5_B_2]